MDPQPPHPPSTPTSRHRAYHSDDATSATSTSRSQRSAATGGHGGLLYIDLASALRDPAAPAALPAVPESPLSPRHAHESPYTRPSPLPLSATHSPARSSGPRPQASLPEILLSHHHQSPARSTVGAAGSLSGSARTEHSGSPPSYISREPAPSAASVSSAASRAVGGSQPQIVRSALVDPDEFAAPSSSTPPPQPTATTAAAPPPPPKTPDALRPATPRGNHAHSRSWAPPSAAMRSIRDVFSPSAQLRAENTSPMRPAVHGSDSDALASPPRAAELHPPRMRPRMLTSLGTPAWPQAAATEDGGRDYAALLQDPMAKEAAAANAAASAPPQRLFPDDPARTRSASGRRRWANWVPGSIAGGLHSRTGSQPNGDFTAAAAAGTTGEPAPTLRPPGERPGHRRSPSTAAAAALSSLRASLHAAGLVSRSIRRPTRSQARKSLVQYKPPPLINNPIVAWLMQLEALVRKSTKVMVRGTPLLLLLAVLGPALAVWLSAVAFRFLSDTLAKAVFPSALNLNGTAARTIGLPECPAGGLYCRVAVSYAPNDAHHGAIMRELAALASLEPGRDVWGFPTPANMLDDYYARNRALQRRPRHYIVQFNTFVNGTDPVSSPPPKDPAAAAAALNGTWYTLGEGNGNPVGAYYDPQLPRDYSLTKGTMLAFKLLLDTAIVNVRSGKRHEVRLNLATFPRVASPPGVRDWSNPGGNGTVVNNGVAIDPAKMGTDQSTTMSATQIESMNQMVILSHYASNIVMGCLLAIGSFPAMLLVVSNLAEDKFDGMLGVLRQMNLFESAYWAAVFVVTFVINAAAAGLAVVPAVVADYPPINAMSPVYVFLVLFLYGMALCGVGALLAVACSSSPYTTSVVTVMSIAVAALLLFVLSLTDLNQLYVSATIVPWWERFVPAASGVEGTLFYVLALMPFFHLGRGMGVALDYTWKGTLGNATATRLAANTTTLIQHTYNYQFDLATAFSARDLTPFSVTALWLPALVAGSLVLAWYANQVTGRTHRWRQLWYFPVLPSYWGVYPRHWLQQHNAANGGWDHSRVELRGIKQEFSVPQPGVCSRARSVRILDGLSLSLARGVCHGLLGHNGAGKSVCLDVLMGSARPTGGDGHVFGAPLGSRAARAAMGVCPQVDVVAPALTAREHLALWARFRGVPRAALDEYIATMLATVSLTAKADAQLRTYSGGMRRRLSILAACVGNPEVLVLDEPSNGLDIVQRRHVWEIVASLKSRGVAVLITSHSSQEIQALSDEVVVLAAPGGRVVLHRNLMELRHEQAAMDILVTMKNPEDAAAHFPRALVKQCRVLSGSTALVSVARADFPNVARFLETPPVLDWELYTSLESYLPPQPGTETHGGTGLTLTRRPGEGGGGGGDAEHGPLGSAFPPLPENPWRIAVLFHQVFGMLKKNLQLQLRQVKHNVLFLTLFVSVMIALTLLVSLGGHDQCSAAIAGGTSPFTLRDLVTGQPSCDVGVYKTRVRDRLAICVPSASNLCSVPDYAPLKQTRYHSLATSPPRLWVRAPPAWQTTIRNQLTLPVLGPRVDMAAMASLAGFDGNWGSVSPLVLQRPRVLNFLESPVNAWMGGIEASQRDAAKAAPASLDDAAKVYPPACLKLAQSMGALPLAKSVADAEAKFAPLFPDFTLDVQTSADTIAKPPASSSSPVRVQIDLRYWGTFTYPFAGFMFPTVAASAGTQPPLSNTSQCSLLGAAPSPDLWGPVAPQLLGEQPSLGAGQAPLTAQTGWPLTIAETNRNKYEGLWLLDGPVRHMVSSATTSLARTAVGPGEVVFSDYMAVPDLQYSTRDELLMNALVCVLLWLFFTMFILVPVAEHGVFLDFYRVNGLSLNAYWASHYLYCLMYSLPFLVVLGGTLAFSYPSANVPHLIVTLLLSTHAVIGAAFLYVAIAVPLLGGSRDMAVFLAYLLPLSVALPCVLWVYSDVLSVPIALTRGNLAFPGLAIAFALRVVLQNFDLDLLYLAYAWLAGVGAACYVACVAISVVQGIAWAPIFVAARAVVLGWVGYRSALPGSAASLERVPSLADVSARANVGSPPVLSHRRRRSTTGAAATAAVPDIEVESPASSEALHRGGGVAGPGSSSAARKQHPPGMHSREMSMTSLLSVDSQVGLEAERVHEPGAEDGKAVLLDGVTKRYRGQAAPVLDGISIGIGATESFGLLGPSGCGKTHVVNIITGQMRATEGRVKTSGRLGLCPQDNVLLDDLSVVENLRFYAHLKGYSPRVSGKAALAASALVGLGPFLDQPARTLSGGMKLSHNMDEVQYLSERIAIMARGQLQCLGTASDLKRKYGDAWRLTLQCGRFAAPEVREWVASLPAVVYASYMHATTRAAKAATAKANAAIAAASSSSASSSNANSQNGSREYGQAADAKSPLPLSAMAAGNDDGVLDSVDTLVAAAAEAAKAGSPELLAAAVSTFQLPQVIETTLADVTPFFAEKIKLEFCIPRVRLSGLTEQQPGMAAAVQASAGAALAALVRAVSAEAKHVGVSEWSVDTCSLEDVFLRVTTGAATVGV
ncbi:hypothetical protein H9P43_005093 [Blastocladiella emersonii ATCC 22665]|nr:hypothetical protein H9P43_005093 [Blastocladiella emersonii ATCC 22665]